MIAAQIIGSINEQTAKYRNRTIRDEAERSIVGHELRELADAISYINAASSALGSYSLAAGTDEHRGALAGQRDNLTETGTMIALRFGLDFSSYIER
jgi:hypothetical protein